MENHFTINKTLWNTRTPIHAASDFYALADFKAGMSSLNEVELGELGNVKGKSMLHLQCHFGMDSLSWAREGARVTGVDFSETAIALAQTLSDELNLEVRFLAANVYDMKNQLYEQFDIVFTSYGVLCWLPDLEKWAETVAHFLKPGGTFLIVEFHPLASMIDFNTLEIKYSYFNDHAVVEVPQGTYADPEATIGLEEHTWNHSLDEILGALQAHRIHIASFREYPYSAYNCFPGLTQDARGRWRLAGSKLQLPLMFSVKGIKI